jgi:hypothetical protein
MLETLLAAALLGALLLALNFFVFSMAEIWGAGAERRLFEQHARAVTREVETWLRTATLPPLAGEAGIFAAEIRLDDGRREAPLSFVLTGGSPRLPWPETALPEVVGSLVVHPGRGLVLYWQSRLETAFDEAKPRSWVVSPLVTAMSYDYQDGNGWRRRSDLERGDDGQWRVPGRLHLQFEHAGMKSATSVTLPGTSAPLPHF